MKKLEGQIASSRFNSAFVGERQELPMADVITHIPDISVIARPVHRLGLRSSSRSAPAHSSMSMVLYEAVVTHTVRLKRPDYR